jgi:hypothetical protein
MDLSPFLHALFFTQGLDKTARYGGWDMSWEKVGEFCGRAVWIARSGCGVDVADLSDSTTFVVIDDDSLSGVTIDALLQGLVSACPLSICVFGKHSGTAFGKLLETLSTHPEHPHIMTHWCEEKTFRESLESFLGSSLPSEERHECWESCRIVLTGSGLEFESLRDQATALLAQ